MDDICADTVNEAPHAVGVAERPCIESRYKASEGLLQQIRNIRAEHAHMAANFEQQSALELLQLFRGELSAIKRCRLQLTRHNIAYCYELSANVSLFSRAVICNTHSLSAR